jgi:cell division protein FtsI/penicillin-binding protein 2
LILVELSKEDIFNIHQLCKSKEDVALRSCAEGHLGKVWVDNADNPQIAISIVIENGATGGENAAAIAKKILEPYLKK